MAAHLGEGHVQYFEEKSVEVYDLEYQVLAWWHWHKTGAPKSIAIHRKTTEIQKKKIFKSFGRFGTATEPLVSQKKIKKNAQNNKWYWQWWILWQQNNQAIFNK